MARFVTAIEVLLLRHRKKKVDARDERGHDFVKMRISTIIRTAVEQAEMADLPTRHVDA
jgi:hypothetical protein